MTVDELRAALARFDGSDLVVVNTITEANKGLWPAADDVMSYDMREAPDGASYYCAVLSVSGWPGGAA